MKLTDGAGEQTTALHARRGRARDGLGAVHADAIGPGRDGERDRGRHAGHDDRPRRARRSRRARADGRRHAVYDEELTRDDGGRITRKVETVDGEETTFDYAYDADRRLLRVDRDGVAAETYTYDADGNRTSRKVGAGPAARSATTARTGSTRAAARTSTTSARTGSSHAGAPRPSTTAPAASCSRRPAAAPPSPTATTASAAASRATRAATRPNTCTATRATRSRSPPYAPRPVS